MKGGCILKEFEEIYKAHYDDVYKFLYRTCGQNHGLAEELTQETFCEAFRCWHKYNASCSVTTWLCAIGKNLWFHYLRKHKHDAVDFDILNQTVSENPADDPQESAERSERSKLIRKTLSSLKPKYQEIIWLRSVAELPFSKVGELMGISENSAKVLFFRAKNTLKEKLSNEGFF